MSDKNTRQNFILNELTLGTRIKMKYDVWNDRMQDYTGRDINEKEDWHNDFADIVARVTHRMCEKSLINPNHEMIRSVRIKKVKFDGLFCQGTLIIYTLGSLDPYEVKTQTVSLSAEIKKQVMIEAEQYIFNDKRRQHEMFAMGEAIIENKVNKDKPPVDKQSNMHLAE